jgi:hypothetical protein
MNQEEEEGLEPETEAHSNEIIQGFPEINDFFN